LRTRRKFTAEFKATAVQLLASKPVAEVARLCDVSVSVLHRWRRKVGEHWVTPADRRRRFTKEFKAYAVEQLERESPEHGTSHGKSTITQVAAALDVPPNTLHRWRKEAREFGNQAFSGYGKSRAALKPARAIKISLQPGEYELLRAAFENSSARSLPDFTRSQLLDAAAAGGFEDDANRGIERGVEPDSDGAIEQAYAEILDTLDDLVGILRRMALIHGAIYGSAYAATCDSSSQSADSHAEGSRPARSHAAG